jgi:hypothetical protein
MNENIELIESSINTYFDIACEAYSLMKKESKKHTKNNGYAIIHVVDWKQKSFKNALIVIVFTGVFIETLFYLKLVKKYGNGAYKKYDHIELKEKAMELGCTNKVVHDMCDQYIRVRKDIVHEKVFQKPNTYYIAQNEAENAFNLLKMLVEHFKIIDYKTKIDEVMNTR